MYEIYLSFFFFLINYSIFVFLEDIACIKGYDYCLSAPCLNDGKCVLLKNCSFICLCDSSSYYGNLCQFTRDPNVYITTQTLTLVVPTNITPVKKSTAINNDNNNNKVELNFNQDLVPCIKQAWIEANPQFCTPFFF